MQQYVVFCSHYSYKDQSQTGQDVLHRMCVAVITTDVYKIVRGWSEYIGSDGLCVAQSPHMVTISVQHTSDRTHTAGLGQ